MKRDAPKEVTFIDTDDPTPAEEQLRLQPNTYVHQTSNPTERGGNAGRGAMSGRGGQRDREYGDRRTLILKDIVPLPHP